MSTPTSATPELTVRTISRAEIRRRLRDPNLIRVNVLPRAAFDDARIPGSRNLPIDEIPAHAAQVLPDRSADIAVYYGGFT